MTGARLARAAAWAALFALVTVALVISLVPGLPGATALDAVTYLLPLLTGAALAFACARRVRGPERRFWGFLFAAMTLMTITETWWTWYAAFVDPNGPHLPSPLQLLHILAIGCFIAMILSLTEFGSDPLPGRIRIYLDIIGAQIVLFCIFYVTWTENLFQRTPGGYEALGWIGAVYPVLGLSMLFAIVLVMGRRSSKWRMWEALVTISVTFFALAMTTWPIWIAQFLAAPKPVSGGLFTVFAAAGYGCLIVGEVYRLSEPIGTPFMPRRFPRARTPVAGAIYSGFLGLAVVGLYLRSLRMPDVHDQRVMLAATVLLALVAAGRSLAVTVERLVLRQRASVDPVTGLAMLSDMRDDLDAAVASARARRGTFAVASLTVDGSKQITMAHGHDASDAMLADIGRRIAAITGRKVYRAGDEAFILIYRDLSHADPEADLRRIIEAVHSHVEVGGAPIWLAGAIARYPRDGSDGERLLAALRDASHSAMLTPGTTVQACDAPEISDAETQLAEARSRAHVAAVRALATAIEQREVSSRGHGRAVADLSRRLGEVLGLSTEQLRALELAALVHDVGKVGVPDRVLSKPQALSEEERRQVEAHPELGERILEAAGMSDVGSWVRSHHERWDGKGYPDGLKGEQIPLGSRILNVTASFEAMTAQRSWRTPMSVVDAVAELRSCAGTQFDPHLVDVFSRLVEGMQGAPAPATLEKLGMGN